jgi:2'-5' RNA ligase
VGTQTALLIPVPEAEALVGVWRHEYDPSARAGVPPHVTVLVPFLPPDQITEGDLSELRAMFEGIEPFDFELARVDWFGRAVLFLAPEPADAFIDITNTIASRFGTPPYEDDFDEVVPHLTVAHATDGVELQPIAEKLKVELPLKARATEVFLMESVGERWSRRAEFGLGPATT